MEFKEKSLSVDLFFLFSYSPRYLILEILLVQLKAELELGRKMTLRRVLDAGFSYAIKSHTFLRINMFRKHKRKLVATSLE